MVYLNEGFEGGATAFHKSQPSLLVTPERGKALVFYHRQLHEGTPVVGRPEVRAPHRRHVSSRRAAIVIADSRCLESAIHNPQSAIQNTPVVKRTSCLASNEGFRVRLLVGVLWPNPGGFGTWL